MTPWKWFKQKVFGDLVKDYGQVFEWTDGGMNRRLALELRRKGVAFWFVTKSTASGGLRREVHLGRVRVTPGLLNRMEILARDVRGEIRSTATLPDEPPEIDREV